MCSIISFFLSLPVYFFSFFFFFFNDTATTEIYTLSLHDALPIFFRRVASVLRAPSPGENGNVNIARDRKSTRLNSSHDQISYAVFCLKKKKKKQKKKSLLTLLAHVTARSLQLYYQVE